MGPANTYRARYRREHYVKKDVRRELYQEFMELCGEPSFTDCLMRVVEVLKSVRGQQAKPLRAVHDLVDDPSRRCTASKYGKSYVVRCEDGSTAFIPADMLPELVERFGLVLIEK